MLNLDKDGRFSGPMLIKVVCRWMSDVHYKSNRGNKREHARKIVLRLQTALTHYTRGRDKGEDPNGENTTTTTTTTTTTYYY